MSTRKSKLSSKSAVSFPLVNTHAAGIDIGSRSNWVAIGTSKSSIREFGVFTCDHHEMAKWLQSHGIRTIAMESTGVYWKSLFLILQSYGFEVLLVNARHIRNVRGKKSDILDCQWIWKLHQAGLLHGSFQPDEITEELRIYNRQRQSLIKSASRSISLMQKSLILMNIQLSVVLSDITGKTGQKIVRSILAGERNGKRLAKFADPRVKASKETIAKALTGQWSEHHLFTLEQSWDSYQFYQSQIESCDTKMDMLLANQVVSNGQHDLVYEPEKKKRRTKNATRVAIDQYAYQLSDGVDLMQVDGISHNLVMTLTAEVGLNLKEKFRTSKHFTSWLSLVPNKKITGGKLLSSKTQKNKNRLALAFKQAANAAGRKKNSPLGHFFRKLAHKKGRKLAITATARKLAVIVYKMLCEKEAFNATRMIIEQTKFRTQKLKYIQKTIAKLNIKVDELDFTTV